MKHYLTSLALFLLAYNAQAQTPIKLNEKSPTRHGPENGSLIIIGGGSNTPEIWQKFLELAGGKEKANVVVITAAIGDSAAFYTRSVDRIKKELGISKVTLLHTKSLTEANSEKFVAPLKTATAVYFEGGRQWRIADSYLNTLVHKAFQEVLERGGVIAGSSAGATIQGSFLWRGDTRGPHILVGDHTQGLGFLKNSAIDQHLLKRNRAFDLVDFIRESPKLIGIGLDESTAIVVKRDTFEVIGKSYVAVYDHTNIVKSTQQAEQPAIDQPAGQGSENNLNSANLPFLLLASGQQYDLKNRKLIVKRNNRSTTTPATGN